MKKVIILLSVLSLLFVFDASAKGKKDKMISKGLSALLKDDGQSGESKYFDENTGLPAHVFVPSDPEYEWSEIDSKKIKVQLKGDDLVFVSKEDDGLAFSIAEMPINVEDNNEFVFGVVLSGPKLDDKKSIGLVFDYENSRNYKGIAIFKKQYDYFVVKDGVLTSVKTGLVKFKGDVYTLTMSRINSKVEFKLNDIEICTIKKMNLTNSMFGAFIHGKMQAVMSHFIMENKFQEDSEQSTTGL